MEQRGSWCCCETSGGKTFPEAWICICLRQPPHHCLFATLPQQPLPPLAHLQPGNSCSCTYFHFFAQKVFCDFSGCSVVLVGKTRYQKLKVQMMHLGRDGDREPLTVVSHCFGLAKSDPGTPVCCHSDSIICFLSCTLLINMEVFTTRTAL